MHNAYQAPHITAADMHDFQKIMEQSGKAVSTLVNEIEKILAFKAGQTTNPAEENLKEACNRLNQLIRDLDQIRQSNISPANYRAAAAIACIYWRVSEAINLREPELPNLNTQNTRGNDARLPIHLVKLSDAIPALTRKSIEKLSKELMYHAQTMNKTVKQDLLQLKTDIIADDEAKKPLQSFLDFAKSNDYRFEQQRQSSRNNNNDAAERRRDRDDAQRIIKEIKKEDREERKRNNQKEW